MIYKITDRLAPCDGEDRAGQTVALIGVAQWESCERYERLRESIDFTMGEINACKAEVHWDCLSVEFKIPTKQNVRQPDRFFMWIEDNGVVIVDDSGKSKSIIDKIIATKRWKKPSLERFIYDFIEMLVAEDPSFLTELEKLLENLEESVFAGEFNSFNRKLMDCRRMLMIFDGFYSQLLHVVSEFEENENGFFEDDNLYYFRMLASRISQTQSDLRALRDYSREVRELYKAQTDMRENEIMKTFTVVTSVFLPLTLITGWYGMNFEHMPELSWEFGYISVGIMCVAVAVLCIWWFKKKKFF